MENVGLSLFSLNKREGEVQILKNLVHLIKVKGKLWNFKKI